MANQQQKDDDSPYFIKIQIDRKFLTYLQDPEFINPCDLMEDPEKLEHLMDNKVYQHIVYEEV